MKQKASNENMTGRQIYICKLSWEMNFDDGIINLEKLELCMKWILILTFAICGASNYNKDAVCVCVCISMC